jgi:hypothetical protein
MNNRRKTVLRTRIKLIDTVSNKIIKCSFTNRESFCKALDYISWQLKHYRRIDYEVKTHAN